MGPGKLPGLLNACARCGCSWSCKTDAHARLCGNDALLHRDSVYSVRCKQGGATHQSGPTGTLLLY